jgi:hypothetical protein
VDPDETGRKMCGRGRFVWGGREEDSADGDGRHVGNIVGREATGSCFPVVLPPSGPFGLSVLVKLRWGFFAEDFVGNSTKNSARRCKRRGQGTALEICGVPPDVPALSQQDLLTDGVSEGFSSGLNKHSLKETLFRVCCMFLFIAAKPAVERCFARVSRALEKLVFRKILGARGMFNFAGRGGEEVANK